MNGVVLRRIEVHQGYSHFTAIARVNESRCVDARDAVVGGETAPRKDESPVPLWNRDRDAGAHESTTTTARNRDGLISEEIAPRVPRVGVAR